MPPQVTKAGGGPATQQPISQEQKDAKSTSSTTATSAAADSVNASEPQQKSQQAQEDPKTAARSHQSSQKHATEKRSQQSMQGQMMQRDLQKKVGKQQPEGLWESMKSAANAVAVESFNKTAHIVDRATADAAMTNAAQKANAHVMQGVKQARDITREQQAKTISSEADRAAHGQPNPEYKKHKHNPLANDNFLAEQGIYANLKPKFEDSEKVIQKMDQYNSQTAANDLQKTQLTHAVRSDSMEKLLGPYGYYTTNTSPDTQQQILDVALYNWRNTPPEARQALHARDKNSPALQGDFSKKWINPPRTSVTEEERLRRSQVVQDPPLPGAYMQPGYQGPRGNRPDPQQVYAKGAHDFQKAGFDVINSMGGGVAAKGGTIVTPAPPRPKPGPSVLLQTAPSKTTGQAKGGSPLDKTQYKSAYEPTVQKQQVEGRAAWEPLPPADTGPKVEKRTVEGNPPPPPKPEPAENTVDTKPPKPKGRFDQGYTLPGKLSKGGKPIIKPGAPSPPEISWLPKKSGTGLTHEQVYEIHRIDSNRLSWSMSPAEHLNQYKHANPKYKDGDNIPMAFTTRDGKVVVNEQRWVRSGEPALWGNEIVDE